MPIGSVHREFDPREILSQIWYNIVNIQRGGSIESLMNHPWKVGFHPDRSLISNHVPISADPDYRAAQFIPSNENKLRSPSFAPDFIARKMGINSEIRVRILSLAAVVRNRAEIR